MRLSVTSVKDVVEVLAQIEITLYWSFTVCLCLPDIGNCDKTNDVRGELRVREGGGEGEGGRGYKSYLAGARYSNIYNEKKTFH